MTYDAREISNDSGRPVFFYEFRWGNSAWFYTSADRDLTLAAQVYSAVPITDGGITVGGSRPGDFQIDAVASLPVVQLFRGTPPSENVRVVALRKHADDLETTVFFAGKINNVKLDGKGKATLLCAAGKQRRGGLRLTWSRSCPHVLYDRQCRLLLANHAYAAVVQTVTGNGFTAVAAPHATAGFFDGGIVSWDADGLGTLERRAIERGTSTTDFLIFGRADGIAVGQAITLHPGCDHLPSTCNTKFNNIVNFGGIAQMPGESPYGVNLF